MAATNYFIEKLHMSPRLLARGVGIYLGILLLDLLLTPLIAKIAGGQAGGWTNAVLNLATPLAAGYLTGLRTNRNAFSHGLAIGILGTLLFFLIATIYAELVSHRPPAAWKIPHGMFVNSVICAFAAMVGGEKFEQKQKAKEKQAAERTIE